MRKCRCINVDECRCLSLDELILPSFWILNTSGLKVGEIYDYCITKDCYRVDFDDKCIVVNESLFKTNFVDIKEERRNKLMKIKSSLIDKI
jgi:hypothetical protein